MYGAEIGTFQKIDQKYFERVQTWCWGRTEISWTDRVKSEDVLHGVKEGGGGRKNPTNNKEEEG